MTVTITQTLVEERLKPESPVASQNTNKVRKPPLPSVLLRSSSFDRLKQFPSSIHAYLCQHGSAEILKWFIHSQTRIHATVTQVLFQLRSILLISSVYAALGLLSIQLGMCILALATVAFPTGFAFLLTCIIAMAVIAVKLNLRSAVVSARQSRSRTRHTKQE